MLNSIQNQRTSPRTRSALHMWAPNRSQSLHPTILSPIERSALRSHKSGAFSGHHVAVHRQLGAKALKRSSPTCRLQHHPLARRTCLSSSNSTPRTGGTLEPASTPHRAHTTFPHDQRFAVNTFRQVSNLRRPIAGCDIDISTRSGTNLFANRTEFLAVCTWFFAPSGMDDCVSNFV